MDILSNYFFYIMLTPDIQYMYRLLYPNLLDSFGRRTKASIESFLGWLTCVRSSKVERERIRSRSKSRSKSSVVVSNPIFKQSSDVENDNFTLRGSGDNKPTTNTTSRSEAVNANNVDDNGTKEVRENNDLVVEEILGKEQIGKLMIALCTFFTFGIANPLLGIIACIFLISVTTLNTLIVARNLCMISKFITDLTSQEGGCKDRQGLSGGDGGAAATASGPANPTDSTLNAPPDANHRTLSSTSSAASSSASAAATAETSSSTELRYINDLEKQLLYSWKGVKSCFKEMIFVIMLFWSLLFFDIIVDSSECSGFSSCSTFEVAILAFISLVLVLMLAISLLMRYQKAYYFDKLSKKIMISMFKLKYPDNNGTSGNRDSHNDNGDGRKNSNIELRTLSISSSSMLPYNSDAGYFVHGRNNSVTLEDHFGIADIVGAGGGGGVDHSLPSSTSLSSSQYPRSRVTSASSLSSAGSRATRSPSVASALPLSSSLSSSSSSLPDTNISSYLNRTISVAMD